jgi:hypothetical protein
METEIKLPFVGASYKHRLQGCIAIIIGHRHDAPGKLATWVIFDIRERNLIGRLPLRDFNRYYDPIDNVISISGTPFEQNT